MATDPRFVDERYPMLRYFSYKHLPEHLQQTSAPFGEVALYLTQLIAVTDERQRELALEHLLEAKDAAVRALLP